MALGGSGLDLHPCLHFCWSSDTAWISGQTLWRPEDTHIHVCFVTHPLRFHQNICKTPTHNFSSFPSYRLLRPKWHTLVTQGYNKYLHITQTDIFSGALFIQVSLGWDLYASTGVLLLVTAIYTVAGKHIHTHTHTQLFVLWSMIVNIFMKIDNSW